MDGKGDPRALPIPEHRPDGSIAVNGDTGIVLVLLPGGTVTLGSQQRDPSAPYHDPLGADAFEDLHQVRLAPFLLARHELTQGQWLRLWTWDDANARPSFYGANTRAEVTLANPVEQVDWSRADLVLTRNGLTLPTEAQWEYACRAGTTTPWNVPVDELELSERLGPPETMRIRYAPPAAETFHWPVGSLRANAFGLFDMHGNVSEWCLDWWSVYGSEQEGDGLSMGRVYPRRRVFRGGSAQQPPEWSRSAARAAAGQFTSRTDLGLRAARALPF